MTPCPPRVPLGALKRELKTPRHAASFLCAARTPGGDGKHDFQESLFRCEPAPARAVARSETGNATGAMTDKKRGLCASLPRLQAPGFAGHRQQLASSCHWPLLSLSRVFGFVTGGCVLGNVVVAPELEELPEVSVLGVGELGVPDAVVPLGDAMVLLELELGAEDDEFAPDDE